MKAIIKFFKDEFNEVVDTANEILTDRKEKKVKERIAEQERVTTESLNNEIARSKYVDELVSQCYRNVLEIKSNMSRVKMSRVKIKNAHRGQGKIQMDKANANMKWLEAKLKEEKYYITYYENLR
jgi:hypothetical protein